jgi:leucyl/phenylalanyl-tRNA--protein transferase
MAHPELAPESLLSAYASGIFPMGREDGELIWLAPNPRAIIDLEAFKTTRSLRSVMRKGMFEVTVNRAFEEVMDACADRERGTWISSEIHEAYCRLHELGFAHSVEAWREGVLAGGLYGVVLGGAFFGESMFYRVTNASKVALAALVERLKERGFTLLDIQFMTEHLRQFGAVEIPRAKYVQRLRKAIVVPCVFDDEVGPTAVQLETGN